MPKDSSTTTWPGRAQHTCPRRSLLSSLGDCWLAQAPPVGIWRPGTSPTLRKGVHSEGGDSPVRMCEIKLVAGSRREEVLGICQGPRKREDVPWAAWM